MAISDEEWNALPEEEKERRVLEFRKALRECFADYDKETIRAAVTNLLEELKGKEVKNE